MRRRRAEVATSAGVVPAELADGPCVETWAEPGGSFPPEFSAWRHWKAARRDWCRLHGLLTPDGLHLDYHRLPPELHDRAPFHRHEGMKKHD